MVLSLPTLGSENQLSVFSDLAQKSIESHTEDAYQIISTPSTSLTEKTYDINRLIIQLNPKKRKEFLASFIERPLQDFVDLLNLLEKEPQRLLFKDLDYYHSDTHFFDMMIRKIVDGSLPVPDKKKLITLYLSNQTDLQIQGIVQYLYHHLEPSVLYPFLILLTDGKVIKAFLKHYTNVPIHRQHTIYQQLIEGLSKQLPPKHAVIPIVLHQTLQHKPKDLERASWQSHLLLNPSSDLSNHAKHCVLWCSDTSLRQAMISKFADTPAILANLIKGSCDLEQHFGRKIKLLCDLTSHLTPEQMDKLISHFISISSEILPYLPCALSQQACENYFFPIEYIEEEDDNGDYEVSQITVLPSLRRTTDFMKACPVDATIPMQQIATKLNSQNRLQRLLNERTILFEPPSHLTDTDTPASPPITNTVQGIRSQIEEIFNLQEDREDQAASVAAQEDTLTAIPPYLLALCLYSPDSERFLEGCMPHWTEQQLNAIGRMISKEFLEQCAQTHLPQLSDIIETVPEDLFRNLCQTQIPTLKKCHQQAERRFNALTILFDALHELTKETPHAQKLSLEQYQQALENLKVLRNSLQATSTAFNKVLENQAKSMKDASRGDQKTIDEYLEIRSDLKALQIKVQKKSFEQTLNKFKPTIEIDQASLIEEDFSTHFLGLLTTEMVKTLGIAENENPLTHLSERGIKSDEDLKVLGYSKEKENTVRLLRRHILDACVKKDDPFSREPENAWSKLFYEEGNFNQKAEAFIQESHLLDLPIDELRTLTLIVIRDYEHLEVMEEKLKAKLTVDKAILEACGNLNLEARTRHDFTLIIKEYLLAALYSFYLHDITVQLQLYLNQTSDCFSLKQFWNTYKKGKSSLSDLAKEKEFHPRDAYNLFKLNKYLDKIS